MKYAILVGNGLSMAYNGDLSVGAITGHLVQEFLDLGGELGALAEEVRTLDDRNGFEQLLGPFDAVSAMIQSLPGLTLGASTEGFRALAAALEAARRIHAAGVARAVSLIAQRAHGKGGFDAIDTFCSSVAELAPAAHITIATLNYDGLLHAGFLNEWAEDGFRLHRTLDTCDLGDGRAGHRFRPDFADGDLRSWGLRGGIDFPSEPARLLNLHGSLGWLRSREGGEVLRFRIPDLRRNDYWAKLTRGETSWEPVVILTNRKTELSAEWPFALAYGAFESTLLISGRWLIAGYGFGDPPVNDMYRRAVNMRNALGWNPPRVLIVGGGDVADRSERAHQALGVPVDWITPTTDRLPEVVDSEQWREWAD